MNKKTDEKKNENLNENREKKDFVAPKCTSHNPLEIMSGWEDKSSDLEF
jgi:hypothetical protein